MKYIRMKKINAGGATKNNIENSISLRGQWLTSRFIFCPECAQINNGHCTQPPSHDIFHIFIMHTQTHVHRSRNIYNYTYINQPISTLFSAKSFFLISLSLSLPSPSHSVCLYLCSYFLLYFNSRHIFRLLFSIYECGIYHICVCVLYLFMCECFNSTAIFIFNYEPESKTHSFALLLLFVWFNSKK